MNGKRVGGDANWEDVERLDLRPHLRAGKNIITIQGKNGGTTPNPAGLFAHVQVDAGGKQLQLGTDEKWLADKKPATVIQGPWAARVAGQIASSVGSEPSSSSLKARAALVRSTLLMRALGRPNREQVVTSRPANLTTLQALELNNGAEFVGYLERGAAKLASQYNGKPDELAQFLYKTTLQRPPNEMELAVARELLGDPTTNEGVADLIWTVLMLPEFQFIR